MTGQDKIQRYCRGGQQLQADVTQWMDKVTGAAHANRMMRQPWRGSSIYTHNLNFTAASVPPPLTSHFALPLLSHSFGNTAVLC